MQCDIVVIGCGAAGLQAAIHAARKKTKVVILGHPESSALWKAHIDNYFGVRSITGKEMLEIGMEQAREVGVEIVAEEAITLGRTDSGFKVTTDGMKELECKALIMATGISRTKLNVPGEREFHGLGVSYCANCDCHFFKKKSVAIIGDGSNAAVAALLLKDYASTVYWISQQRKASPELVERVRGTSIQMIDGWPAKITGEQVVKVMELQDGKVLAVDGIFIELGAKGAADMALEVDLVADEEGRLPVDARCKTEVEGVYACGDITGQPWQVARAVGQGCVAGLEAAAFVRKEKE
ncbi:MAG: thioredoxin reductase [Methanomassiliicoccales archaeon PtaU1.Bin124]|nr:MAG: thioredoxin reductase [Methanomassiliicoccales archaeon PtaU1.Bin124]